MAYEQLQSREINEAVPLRAVQPSKRERMRAAELDGPIAAYQHTLQRLTDGKTTPRPVTRAVIQRTLPAGAPDADQIRIGDMTTAHDAVADIKAHIIANWATKTQHFDGPGGSERWRIAWGSNTAFIGFSISTGPHEVVVYHAQSQANKDKQQAAKKDDYKEGGDKAKGIGNWFASRMGAVKK